MSDPQRHQPIAEPEIPSGPLSTEPRTAAVNLDAVGRLAHLNTIFERDQDSAQIAHASEERAASVRSWRDRYVTVPQTSPQEKQTTEVRPGSVSTLPRRLLKTALGLGLVGLIGYAPLQRLLQTSSVEAVVNARIITLRAPIDGEVQAGPTPLTSGAPVARGEVLFRIVNRRADRTRVDDLTRELERLKEERPGIAARLAKAQALLIELNEQTRLFAESRILQLEARQGEQTAEVAAAQARNEAAKIAVERTTKLAGNGVLSMSQLTQAERDSSVAEKLELAARKRLEAAGVELSAAKRGIFVGDSYNDRPRSSQRADELQQQVSNLAETLAETEQSIARLSSDLAKEKAHLSVLAEADMVAPTNGSVWETLTSPQEQVHRGQDLVRLLDCAGAVVTAVVSEAVYNRLQIGSPARFLLRDSNEELPGTVVRLTGASASPANFAIQPSLLVRESYHVTVFVPKLAEGGSCMVGRTGRVIFDAAPISAQPDAQLHVP
jgi:multidrug resistance efflux pump